MSALTRSFLPAAGRPFFATLGFILLIAGGTACAASAEWLSLCSKCLSPSVTTKSGIGTSNAVAEGRISPADIRSWCENWEGNEPKSCVREQSASSDVKRTYRATADCPAGRMIAVDGNSYTLAGTWVGDIGAGRPKFRDAKGQIIGRSNAENGLALAQNWEILCPGQARPAPQAAAARPLTGVSRSPAPSAAMPPSGLQAEFTVGQIIEAKYESGWVRGRVNAIRAANTARGPVLAYDVILANGKRGVVPARTLRQPQ